MPKKVPPSITFLFLLIFACNHPEKQAPTTPATPDSTATTNPASATTTSSPATKKTILFFGNSLTAGYGVSPTEAFPALIGRRIDSLHLPYHVVNAGLSGETSAGGKTRISWILKQPISIFVLELGGNDGLRGIPLAGTTANLQAIIDSVKLHYPEARIVVAGMQIPPNMGADYGTAFRDLFPKLAAANDVALIPFLLQNVGGIPQLNQGDGIHPTAAGHKIVAENVWQVLAPLLKN
jgi:acyl-CoA thioesterase-1